MCAEVKREYRYGYDSNQSGVSLGSYETMFYSSSDPERPYYEEIDVSSDPDTYGAPNDDESDLSDDEELPTPIIFPLYPNQATVVNILGSGAFGVVSKAKVKDHENDFVAVKHCSGDHGAYLIKKEIAVHSTLDSEFIIDFLGCNDIFSPTVCFIEFAEKGTLYNRIFVDKSDISMATVLEFASQLAQGLAYLHSKDNDKRAVVHGDLKCDNVLITEAGRLKISDFGCSFFADLSQDEMNSVVRQYGGAPEIQPPEQLTKQSYASAKGDIYALALIMWELVSREKLFPDLRQFDAKAIKKRVVDEGFRPSFPTNTPLRYSALTQICWNSSPEVRPEASTVVNLLSTM